MYIIQLLLHVREMTVLWLKSIYVSSLFFSHRQGWMEESLGWMYTEKMKRERRNLRLLEGMEREPHAFLIDLFRFYFSML